MAVEGCARIIRNLLFVFNFIFFLGGVGLLGVGIYVQLKIGDYVELSSVKYVTGPIIIIAVGAIIAVIAFFGCCGAIKESRCLLGTFFALMLLIFGLEVAGTALGFVYRAQVKDELMKDLNETLSQYGTSDRKGVTQAFDLLQEKEKCCGVNNYKDWQRTPFTGGNHTFVPDSCCKEVKTGCGVIPGGTDTSKINTEGCYDKTLDLLRDNLIIICGIGVAVAVIQLLSMIFAMVMMCKIKDQSISGRLTNVLIFASLAFNLVRHTVCITWTFPRNAYTRGVEHTEGLENQDERSALWKHCVEKHEKERQEFKMSVTGVYGNDAMLRQIAESVRINRVAKGSLINTKKEWNYVKLPRVVLDE